MDPEQTSNQFRAVFDESVELPPAEREKFLDLHCGSDLKLRAAVESLLLAHDRAGTFLADPAIPADLLQAREQLSAGTRIGRYALIRVLGEGGHGTVYLAEQDPPLRRRVALKVIKAGMDTAQVIARFDSERQALAMMEHPNIARIFDAGSTATGNPYFVMELVDGMPVTDFCRAFHLDLDVRLQLFTRICAAVHHAHQKGVIHRDLKPKNVLVILQDGMPMPKIIDFGISKALLSDACTGESAIDESSAAQPEFLGTPQYMSPEQARVPNGTVDWRSDVYSLGALLYQLLTDVPPFDPAELRLASYGEISRILNEVEPPLPSDRLVSAHDVEPAFAEREAERCNRLPLVRGDLDQIVMKAMRKDPRERYNTADALASDVEQFRNGQPIKPPSTRTNQSWRSSSTKGLTKRHRDLAFLAIASIVFAGGVAEMVTTHSRTDVHSPATATVGIMPVAPVTGQLDPGLNAVLYNGSEFRTVSSSRIDRQIDFVWPRGVAPTDQLKPPHYSIRWHGVLVVPANGLAALGARADDGIHIRLDNVDLVTIPRPGEIFSYGEISAGRHEIEIEYWNRLAEGAAQLLWLRRDPAAVIEVVPPDALFHQR